MWCSKSFKSVLTLGICLPENRASYSAILQNLTHRYSKEATVSQQKENKTGADTYLVVCYHHQIFLSHILSVPDGCTRHVACSSFSGQQCPWYTLIHNVAVTAKTTRDKQGTFFPSAEWQCQKAKDCYTLQVLIAHNSGWCVAREVFHREGKSNQEKRKKKCWDRAD